MDKLLGKILSRSPGMMFDVLSLLEEPLHPEPWLARAAWNNTLLLMRAKSQEWSQDNSGTQHRQFVLWQHGRLGVGRRVVIASCCVWNIRDTFPDPRAHYTRFRVRCLDM